MKRSRIPTAALVVVVLALVAAALGAVLLIGDAVNLHQAATQQGSTRASLYILLFGAVVMVVLFAAFLYIGIEDWRHDLPISPLYWPQVAVKGSMAAYMLFIAPSVVDLLAHGLRPRWGILYTPVAKLCQSALLLMVFASFAWVLAALLRGRTASRRDARDRGLLARIKAADIRARWAKRLAERLRRRVDVQEERIDHLEGGDAGRHTDEGGTQ